MGLNRVNAYLYFSINLGENAMPEQPISSPQGKKLLDVVRDVLRTKHRVASPQGVSCGSPQGVPCGSPCGTIPTAPNKPTE